MFKKIVFFLVSAAIFPITAMAADSDYVNIYEEPRKFPARPFYSPTGQKLTMADFKGDFVVLVLWSRYCAPCVKELDELNEYASKVKNDGIRVILLSKASEWNGTGEQKRFLEKYDAPDLEYYSDEKGMVAEDLGIFTSPNTVLINRQGKEIGRIRGSINWDNDDVAEYIYKIKAQHG